jgi:hypothetical protein
MTLQRNGPNRTKDDDCTRAFMMDLSHSSSGSRSALLVDMPDSAMSSAWSFSLNLRTSCTSLIFQQRLLVCSLRECLGGAEIRLAMTHAKRAPPLRLRRVCVRSAVGHGCHGQEKIRQKNSSNWILLPSRARKSGFSNTAKKCHYEDYHKKCLPHSKQKNVPILHISNMGEYDLGQPTGL